MPHPRTYRKTLILLLLACWLATPASAYTIYLKDGSRILARDKYTVDADRAIIILESGTETFLALEEIDVQRTEEANKMNIGNALVFEDGRFVERAEIGDTATESETVADLIDRGEATVRGTSPDVTDATGSFPDTARTDIERAQRQPMDDLELATALEEAFTERGLEGVLVFQGTELSRPLVELVADTEPAAFHGLEVAADVLLAVRELHPGCDLIELLMTTADQERAGEFALTPEMAESIRAEEVEISAFFVRNVRF